MPSAVWLIRSFKPTNAFQRYTWLGCSGYWDTARLLDRRALQAALSTLLKAQPRRLVMDEFALFKGYRYASAVLDADTRRGLRIGEGRSRAAVWPVLEELRPEGCAQTEAMAIDMNSAFDLDVRLHCTARKHESTKARKVYDLFQWPNMDER